MSAKNKATAAIAIGAIFLTLNTASAQHRTSGRASARHPPRVFENVPRQLPRQVPRQVPREVPQSNSRADVYSSDSLGHQSFPNPDRDFSIQNLQSHAY
jgi:hypothetical protein